MRAHHRLTHPRTLHPGAWWLWALGLGAAATRTTNPVPLLLVIVVSWFVATARRDGSDSGSFALFFRLALVVIALHVVLQALLSRSAQGTTVLLDLPEIPLPSATGLKLGGQVTLEAVLAAVYRGLQLAAIFCCIGAANAVGNARRLLRSLPAAVYELGIATTIALTFAPQLVTDARRVNEAARLRDIPPGVRRLGRLAMPVFEGSLERSVDLAAAMDARGYGRTGGHDPARRRVTIALVLAGGIGLAAGLYGLLTQQGYGLIALLAGAVAAVAGLRLGARRIGRTRYRPDPWGLPELLVVGCGLAPVVAAWWTASARPELAMPSPEAALPAVPLIAVLGILVALLPAFLTPPVPVEGAR